MELNINHQVKVQLTELGKTIYSTKDVSYGFPIQMPIVDDEGYTQFTLWDLCSIYGPYMYNGAPNLFNKNIISIKGEIDGN